jgi:hypothetical protein
MLLTRWPATNNDRALVSLKRTLTNRLGVVNISEWILTMAFAMDCC